MLILTLFLFCSGFFIIYLSNDENLRELSYGIIVLGIGMIGMIKMGTEMAVYHGTKKPKEIPGE
jgi:divalent metal cation (Fe/Co/Zn/Cd) transporter